MHTYVELAAVGAASASLALYATLTTSFALGWSRRESRSPERCPRVTIFKPVAGVDDDLRDNLESFARLDYPSFELLIGVADPDDDALPTVRAFLAAHPALDAKLIFTNPNGALNPKIAQLLTLERYATGEIFLISDANVRVAANYLDGIVAELLRPGVGLVSNVVAGTGEESAGAALENLQLGAHIAPGVVAMKYVGGPTLTIGKSMAMWRRELARIGGFASVGDVLAEDFVLGRKFLRHGYEAAIVHSPVENRNVRCSMKRTVERHTRWAKMRRAIMPGAFFVEPISSPIAVALVAALVAPCRSTLALFVVALFAQMAFAALAVRAIRGHALPLRYLALEPVRALALQLCWLRAVFSRRVDWRGHPFVLGKDSVLRPVRTRLVRATAR